MALGNRFDITINQGATFELTITWKDSAGTAINLSGYTARMQVRETYSSATSIVSLTNAAGITLGGAAGTVAILISATTTMKMSSRLSDFAFKMASSMEVVQMTPSICRPGEREMTMVVLFGRGLPMES